MSLIDEKRPIFAISGPTASGKTALGVKLAEHISGEVVNFDSVQIYRGIQIATAKPTAEEMRGVPHHLIDYVDPRVNYTAADWAVDAGEKIKEIEARGNTVILVGGTGFYLRSLQRPLFESPKTDAELRKRLHAIKAAKGVEHIFRMLKRLDPKAASELPERDHVRVLRALEVYFQTGERISELRPNRPEPPAFAERIRLFVLEPPRAELYAKIDRRTEEHFSSGLLKEVKQLLSEGVNPDTNALGAHAYRRVCEYFSGERTLENAIVKSKQDVRNYAKRQLTWFRRENVAKWLRGFGDDPEVWGELKNYIGL